MRDSTTPFDLVDIDEIDKNDDQGSEPDVPADEFTLSSGALVPRRRAKTQPAAKLDLNEASLEELEQLPGLGPLRARRIMAWRERNGRFESIHDLRYVRGLGEGALRELVPYLAVIDDRAR